MLRVVTAAAKSCFFVKFLCIIVECVVVCAQQYENYVPALIVQQYVEGSPRTFVDR